MSELSEVLANAKADRSIDDIAQQATRRGYPISRAVVAKYVIGDHGPKVPEKTLRGLAAGLDLDVQALRKLAGRPAGEPGPWVPVEVAASLTRQQRDALDALIVAIVKGESNGPAYPAEKSPDFAELGASEVEELHDPSGREQPTLAPDPPPPSAGPRRGRRR